MVHELAELITGDKFIELADYTFSPYEKREDDYCNLPNTLDLDKLKDGDIIYTHTMYAKNLFDIIGGLSVRLKVVTHNSDENVTYPPPKNVTMWYTQNVNIEHPRVQSIPIGLENDRWFKELRKKEKILVKCNEKKYYRNLVYMNFNIVTNPAKRQPIYDALKDKWWVTNDMHPNGYNYDNYVDNVYNHKFVICPEGNGIDTHRIWEALYLGTIPIVMKNINNSFYWDFLPVTVIGNVDELDYGFLENDAVMYFLDVWNMEMLKFSYWKNKILNNE